MICRCCHVHALLTTCDGKFAFGIGAPQYKIECIFQTSYTEIVAQILGMESTEFREYHLLACSPMYTCRTRLAGKLLIGALVNCLSNCLNSGLGAGAEASSKPAWFSWVLHPRPAVAPFCAAGASAFHAFLLL